MNVLHYSFSLSACPKCHLLVCKHTSLADLDFNLDQQLTPTNSIETNIRTVNDGINLYLFPSTIIDNRYSWTTFGTELNGSASTIRHLSSNDETICENIPFANENLRRSVILVTPTINQIVQTQSEKCEDSSPTKTLSFHSIEQQSTHLPTKSSLSILCLLIFTFLLTNTIDIVLIYTYAYINTIYLISYLCTIIICDMIIWIDELIQSKIIPSFLFLIPFYRRFYLLYKLLECLMIIFEKNRNRQIFFSLLKTKKQKLFQQLTVFYLVHTSIFLFVNLYFWSNQFQLSKKLILNMNYFIPRWIEKVDSTLTIHSILPTWQISNPISSASTFIVISISYYLMINYCLLSTYLSLFLKRTSLITILSKFCLIIPRLYAFVFLFHLNIYWLSITFLLVHLILMLIMTLNRKNLKDKRLFLQLIFSFVTHESIDDVSINTMISIENISIFLHQLYLQMFSAFFHYQTMLRLIILISILISSQIIGFVCYILSKHLLYNRTKSIAKLRTDVNTI